MQRTSFKPKPCPECGSLWHSKSYHNKRKPMRLEAVKTRAKRLSVREEWFGLNKPDSRGFWYCYLQIAPDCPKRLTEATLILEHQLSKARRPDLKFSVKNLKPSCNPCNKLKGSRSAAEVVIQYSGLQGDK